LAVVDCGVPLQIRRRKRVREERQRKRREMGGRRRRGVHRRRRIWPIELANAVEFGEGFRDGLAMNLRRGKGGRGQMPGAIYRRSHLPGGARV
jgi:hypothetical protein